MIDSLISKPIHKILTHLTGEERFEVALPLATKDLVRLKLKEREEHIFNFEKRYGMNFDKFKTAWENNQIDKKYSYEVEKDYWEWEAAMTDQQSLSKMFEELQ